jgi:5-formyltetrahydrofolate cyclo-ligase
MDASEMRKRALERRAAMPAALRLQRSDAIWKRLVEVPEFQQAPQALFFITHGSEVETEVMRRLSRELGMVVAAPRAEPSSRAMRFHVLDGDEALIPGPYGILQPSSEAPLAALSPDTVVLVPGSVFDRRGNRLGFGGGYYDRWLAGEGKGLPTVGLAFHEQLVEQVPVQPHDVPLRWIVTDKESVDCSAAA